MGSPTASSLTPPTHPSPRFTIELEFVLSLSNPYYLSHLALTYPHILNKSTASSTSKPPTSSLGIDLPVEDDATLFAAYLSYLYGYWKTPQYSRYLTHPGAVLRNLELLQQESFRRDIIRPDLIAKLLEGKVDSDSQVDGNGQANGVEVVVQDEGQAKKVGADGEVVEMVTG